MFEEFVGLVVCRLAIVSCDCDIQVLWEHVTAQIADLFENVVRDHACVCALALSQSDGYSGIFSIGGLSTHSLRICKQHIAVWLGPAILDFLHHIAQINRTATVNSDYNLLQVVGTSKKQTRFHLKLAVVTGETANLFVSVRALQLTDDGSGRETIGGESLCIQDHANLTRLPADDRRLRNVIEFLERVF